MMKNYLFFGIQALLAAFSLLSLTSCGTTEMSYEPSRIYVPRVSLPMRLNENEQRLLPEVEEVLTEAGYRTTRSRAADYDLSFTVADGPINADTTITLTQDGETIARGYARVGGPQMIFAREKIVNQSFSRALDEFEEQLPTAQRHFQSRRRIGDYDRTDDNRRSSRRFGYSDEVNRRYERETTRDRRSSRDDYLPNSYDDDDAVEYRRGY